MSHNQFISAHQIGPFGFLISTPKSLRILLVHKIQDPRFQSLLFNWACALSAVLGTVMWGFSLMPMFLAVAVLVEGVSLFLLVLSIGAGEILLDFALEDENFFELATRCHALSVLEEVESCLPQPEN